MLPHGEWQNWLEDNFNLSYQTAAKFMQVAERFSNVALIRDLNSTQLITMLALPAEDTEKFIEQAAGVVKKVFDAQTPSAPPFYIWRNARNDICFKVWSYKDFRLFLLKRGHPPLKSPRFSFVEKISSILKFIYLFDIINKKN